MALTVISSVAGPRTNCGRTRWCLWVLVAAVVYSFFATAGRWYLPFSPAPERVRTFWYHNYYALLSEGFRHGQLALAQHPSAKILALANPYADKVALFNHGLLDTALYRSNYYLYHGPAPALTLFLPLRLICGVYPSAPFAVVVFLTLAFGVQLWLVWQIFARWFPGLPRGYYHLAALALGFQNGALFAIAPAEFYEVACASAACWYSTAWLLLYWSGTSVRRPWLWAGAALCLVLATASRPHFAVITALTAGVLGIVAVRHTVRPWLWFVGVCGAGALALLWYNYQRFDNVFELGIRYQINMLDQAWTPKVGLRTWWENVMTGVRMYWLQPPQWAETFPYLFARVPSAAMVARAGAFSAWREETAGFFVSTPLLVLGVLGLPALIRSWGGAASGARRMRAFVVLLLAAQLALTLIVLGVPAVAMRYALDFVPGLLVVACVSVAAMDQAMAARTRAQWPARLWRALVVASVLAGCVTHVLLGFSGRSNAFRHLYPGARASMAAVCPDVARWRAHGEVIEQYSNGIVRVRYHVLAGTDALRDGQFTEWHANGVKKSEGQYRAGQSAGWWTWWHTNGVRAMEGRFEDGRHDQWWMWWDEDGRLVQESYYVRGTHVDTRTE